MPGQWDGTVPHSLNDQHVFSDWRLDCSYILVLKAHLLEIAVLI